MSAFAWTKRKRLAVELLAQGESNIEVAKQCNVDARTVRRWRADITFSDELDRMTLATGIATRAERMRVIKRACKQFENEDGKLVTRKDLADWVKLAQEEGKVLQGERLVVDDFATLLERVYGGKDG